MEVGMEVSAGREPDLVLNPAWGGGVAAGVPDLISAGVHGAGVKPSRGKHSSTPGRTRLEDRSSPESRANSTPPPAMANKAGADNGGAKTDERVRLAKERRQELEKMQASRGELFQEKERKARELYERFMAERRRRLAEQRQREEERRVAVDEKRKQKLAEDKARYEASISRAQEKGPPRRDPRNRWSWGGAIPSNHTASPRKHLDNPDRRSVSTVNLSRHPPDSVVSKRLSMSSATLLNSPDRPGSSGKRKKTNGRRSQLTPMEMSIVSRLLTPTHSSMARSRSVATLSGEGHCPVFPVCPRSAFASPALTPTHSKQQHRHRSRSQERRFKPFSTPSPLVERLKKEKRISSPGAGLSASPILRPPRRSEPPPRSSPPPPRSSPQAGGTTTPVTSGKTSGPLRANHPSPAATAAFVSSKPPSGPQTPRPRVDRKDVKEAKEAKEGKEGRKGRTRKRRRRRRTGRRRRPRRTAGSKVATPNVAAPVSPLPLPPPSSPQAAGGYREKAAVTPAPATERRGADGAPAEVDEAPAAVAARARRPKPCRRQTVAQRATRRRRRQIGRDDGARRKLRGRRRRRRRWRQPRRQAVAVAATATATAVTKTPKKSGAAEGDAARPSAATEEATTRTPGGGKGRSDEAKASSSGGGGGGGGGKGLAGSTNAEDATRALAEKRKLAREQREKEEQERIAHAEAEKRMKEEIARRKAEERARREEEARRLEEERRVQEEEERRRAEEDRERREIEERERQVEIQKQREEAEVRAREEAEKQRVERARQAHKEEQERLERKKRLEQIMKRTRKSEPNKEKEGKDIEDAPDQQSNGDTGDSPGLLSLNGQTHAREAPTGNGSAAVGSLTTEGSNGRDFEELIDLAMEPRSMKAAVTNESGDAPADAVGSATTTAPPPNPPLIAFEENGDSLA
ncbi:ensconsin-like [Lethenteron reissneri]|uniref:ensconsin-like n=1 Tax=Lethenteron reissneri TaxID=7753 RepID=UPI002AB6ACFF|nr:ensconsin-like [Lethenteron reissneri]